MTPHRAIAALAVYNIIQNSLLRERGYVAGNLAVTGLGLVWARRSGLDWRDLGIAGDRAPAGLRLGLGVATLAWVLVHFGRRNRAFSTLFEDERLEKVSKQEANYRLMVRFPLGTALFEEVWFRGLLPASMRQHGVARPDLISNVVFAAWHLIPTANAVAANRIERTSGPLRRSILVVGGSSAAGLAGLAFSALRRATTSLVAPWVVHAAVNGMTYWAGMEKQRSTRPT